jgi:hypothetical protein
MMPRHGSHAEPFRTHPTAGERFLLTAIRAWAKLRAAGEQPHAIVEESLALQASSRVAGLFTAWIRAVESTSRRPIQIQCAHCGGLSSDEQRLIYACGLSAVAMDVGARLIAPVVFDARPVMALGRALNAGLAAVGLPLPARLIDVQADNDAGISMGAVASPTVH